MRVVCYDTEADSLSVLQPSGASPTSRGGHSVSLLYPCITCLQWALHQAAYLFHFTWRTASYRHLDGRKRYGGDASRASLRVLCRVPRCMQATVVNSSLFIFGGEDASRRPVSDLHVLDLASMTWRDVTTTGRAPAARSAHATVPYKVGSCGKGCRNLSPTVLLLPCRSFRCQCIGCRLVCGSIQAT